MCKDGHAAIFVGVLEPEEAGLVAGANKPDTHLRNVSYERDWQADIVTDISEAREGNDCARCEGGAESEEGPHAKPEPSDHQPVSPTAFDLAREGE